MTSTISSFAGSSTVISRSSGASAEDGALFVPGALQICLSQLSRLSFQENFKVGSYLEIRLIAHWSVHRSHNVKSTQKLYCLETTFFMPIINANDTFCKRT